MADARFPTLVYRSPGPHFGPGSSTYESRPAKDEAELEAALEAGFHMTLPQAVGLAPADPTPSEARAAEAAEVARKQKEFDDAVDAKVAAELAKKKPTLEKIEPDSEREALEAEAKSLGIAHVGNMSTKTLSEKIAAKKAG